MSSPVIVIPTYREASNLASLLPRIQACVRYPIIVVDDNSQDGTAATAAMADHSISPIRLIERTETRSFGASILDGLKRGLIDGHDTFVIMDADFSHPPERIESLHSAVNHSNALPPCVALGSRFVSGGRDFRSSLIRKLMSRAAPYAFQLFSGIRLKDPTSGFRCFNLSAVKILLKKPPTATGFAFHIEALLILKGHGAEFIEIPITFQERRKGDSKLCIRNIAEWIWFVSRARDV